MKYSGDHVFEFNVPQYETVPERIWDFYDALGWSTFSTEKGLMITAVPPVERGPVDGLGYWQTDTGHKTTWFEDFDENDAENLSIYTTGLRLPYLMDLVERPLLLPSDEDVRNVFERGGQLMNDHSHTGLREHAGRLEFRYADPFLFGVRVVGPKTEHRST